ncbi:MAG: exodeoxyribonuclease VII small subunit [Bacteroidales bacterium]
MNYQKSIDELENIIKNIESDEISVDELSQKVKRATELISVCHKALHDTEENVQDILRDINSGRKKRPNPEK